MHYSGLVANWIATSFFQNGIVRQKLILRHLF